MQSQHTHDEAVKKLGELIKDIKFAMLTTTDTDGSMHSRPMATQQFSFDGDLWFFTDRTTQKVEEILQDKEVNVSYANPDKDRYVSVSGRAHIVRDRAKIKELWNPIYQAWFPEGVEDPNLVLIRVPVDQAEYWNTPDGKLVQVYGFVKSLIVGKRPVGIGEHEKIAMEKVG